MTEPGVEILLHRLVQLAPHQAGKQTGHGFVGVHDDPAGIRSNGPHVTRRDAEGSAGPADAFLRFEFLHGGRDLVRAGTATGTSSPLQVRRSAMTERMPECQVGHPLTSVRTSQTTFAGASMCLSAAKTTGALESIIMISSLPGGTART